MYQVPFPKLNNGGSLQWVALRACVFNLFLVAGLILDSYIYLHIGWEISLNFSGTSPRKEKKRTPPCLFHISWNFFSLSLSRSGCWGFLVIYASIDPPSFLSLSQQLAISELFDCLT